MKILMVADVPPNPNSGAAGTEYQTMLALRELGHTVDCIWENDLRHWIRHGNLHYLLELPWAYRDAIRAHTTEEQYDVIHVNQPYAWLAARDHRRFRRGGVFVNRSHGWETRVDDMLNPWRRQYGVPEWQPPRGVVGIPMKWWKHRYAAWCAHAVDGIIVSSTGDREYIVDDYGLPQEKVACIPQAAAAVFHESPVLPMSSARLKRVLYVGTSAFVKGVHIVAAVFSRLSEQCPALSFTWCCPAEKFAECRLLLNPACRDKVRFVNWVTQEELVRLYDENGIFLFPSLYEGFGKAPLEAMARGMCVVTSDTGGMRDIIRNNDNGCLITVGDVDGFCREVDLVLSKLEIAGCISRAAAKSAREYSWARVADETVSFYRQLLASKQNE
ncbi:MAG: glycosyltransferase family 4 protein [Kiritimatiellia bacterium]